MTAITLNLLAEEQQVQEERARDPFKIFIAIGLTLLATAVACGSTLSVMQGQKRAELQKLETQWEKMNQASEQEGEFQRTRALAEEIVALNHSRMLLAPQLAMVKDLIPPTVQLSHLNFAVETANISSAAENGEGTKRARPKQIERLVLLMDGTARSERPELELDRFLRVLRTDARFSAVVDDIQLRSISRDSGNSDKMNRGPASVAFVIECRYKEREGK
ncbi:MAG TPA: hypothetical protein VL486_14280 [Verrucomicrobiae bacterium]|nr:hypothetical protein [Verrucomicrobiae bacterium]